ncbi:hypothetical protein J7337_007134 [Fusarium musae]|uniref:NADH dehydrogenase (Ubiquinone) 1 beta subcomplex 9 n=1 Tax=Fusarium musae TaxID=1042133 RepID=A0A9P8DGG7_9HYPO|nr:hypothetical protein J7337_007134 [Fusarium musae]KAG9501446.1 hypothetical protein J7337_007134 [Fusarium musae]
MSPIPDIKGFVTNWRLEDDLDADSDAQALLTETEKLLESWKHPDPYTPPTAPGAYGKSRQVQNANDTVTGSKFERNLPSPVLDPPPHPVNRH